MTDSPFQTPEGIEVPAVTADQMRAVDRVAVEDVGVELLQMMENAGRSLAWHARDIDVGSVLVLAGTGEVGSPVPVTSGIVTAPSRLCSTATPIP